LSELLTEILIENTSILVSVHQD